MLPCPRKVEHDEHKSPSVAEDHHRRLLWYDRRFLGGHSNVKGCKPVSLCPQDFVLNIDSICGFCNKLAPEIVSSLSLLFQGYVPLISVNGLHQLHIFIFFLAVFHVFYSAITMTLGRLKVGSTHWIFSSSSFSYIVILYSISAFSDCIQLNKFKSLFCADSRMERMGNGKSQGA